MAVLVIASNPGGTAESDAQAIEMLNLNADPPAGGLFRLSGPIEGGWRIVSLWESREAFDKFLADRLRPMLSKVGRAEPQFEFWPIESVRL